jgi:uncharacterized protein YoxC
MANGNGSLFETYKDKSNSLQRLIIIFLGVAFFFFFMILVPYYSLRTDTHKLSNIYEMLNKTLDDIRYAANALSDQYTQNLKQNLILTQSINTYVKQLQNINIKDDDLKNITDTSCNIFKRRSTDWINCNFKIRNEELQRQLKATIKLNSTTVRQIQDAISRQTALLEESKGFLDFNKIARIKAAFENLTSGRSVKILFGLQPTVLNLTQGVNKQISNLLTQTTALSTKFKSLETPLGGNIPVSFNELLAVFPLALSIVFCYFALMLRDTIRLRTILVNTTPGGAVPGGAVPIKEYISKSPSWIDPKPSGSILHHILTWTVLAMPVLLFIGSIIMISSIWSWQVGDKFSAFAAATEFNKLIYSILYVIGGMFFGFSYILIIKEIRKN